MIVLLQDTNTGLWDSNSWLLAKMEVWLPDDKNVDALPKYEIIINSRTPVVSIKISASGLVVFSQRHLSLCEVEVFGGRYTNYISGSQPVGCDQSFL
jgi:hypothetical protein